MRTSIYYFYSAMVSQTRTYLSRDTREKHLTICQLSAYNTAFGQVGIFDSRQSVTYVSVCRYIIGTQINNTNRIALVIRT